MADSRPAIPRLVVFDHAQPKVHLREALRDAMEAISASAARGDDLLNRTALPFDPAPYAEMLPTVERRLARGDRVVIDPGGAPPEVVACRWLATAAGVATGHGWSEEEWDTLVTAAELWTSREIWLVAG